MKPTKTRIPKLLREILIVIQFLVFLLIAIRLAFNAEFGWQIGRFTGEYEGWDVDVNQIWRTVHEPLVSEMFAWFAGLCILRFAIVMIWNAIRTRAEKRRRKSKSVSSSTSSSASSSSKS